MHGERSARRKITRIFKPGETTVLSPSVRMSLRYVLACARLFGRILRSQCQKALQLTVASATGLEICSLVYPPLIVLLPVWWSQSGSNRRPPACKAGALPAELWPRKRVVVVGLGRFELPTSRLSGVRSNQLSYRPETPRAYADVEKIRRGP